jgi:TRAP-type C4-dicarboxylate transport system permease small subunit
MMVRFIDSILTTIKRVETFLIISILTAIIVVTSLQVILRYFFSNPLPWPEELCSLLLIYLCYFSADVIVEEKGHIAIDYFVNLLPEKARKVVSIVINFMIGIFLAVIFMESIGLVKAQSNVFIAASIRLPKSFWILPVALVFPSMLLSTVNYAIKEIAGEE